MTGVIAAAALSEVNPLKKLFGVVTPYLLAASLLGNVVLGIALHHYVTSAVSCKTAVMATTQAAKKTQLIVQTREVKNAQSSQAAISSRLTGTLSRLHDSQGRVGNLSVAPTGAISVDGTPPPPVVLPERGLTAEEKADQEICVTNTILLEGWQDFYQKQLDTFSEELQADVAKEKPPGGG